MRHRRLSRNEIVFNERAFRGVVEKSRSFKIDFREYKFEFIKASPRVPFISVVSLFGIIRPSVFPLT